MMKLPVLCLALASAVASTTVLVVAEMPAQQSTTDTRTNLDQVKIIYDITVNHMNKITLQEADTMKAGVKTAIVDKLNTLDCQENTDYTVTGLDDIFVDQDLNAVTITVNAVNSSEKIKGTTDVIVNVKEDISDRVIDPTIKIPQSEQNSLSDITAIIIKNTITIKVEEIVTASQKNQLGIDYTIDNLDKIKEGAAFNDFKEIIFVKSISTSTTLTGNFKINFQLTPNSI